MKSLYCIRVTKDDVHIAYILAAGYNKVEVIEKAIAFLFAEGYYEGKLIGIDQIVDLTKLRFLVSDTKLTEYEIEEFFIETIFFEPSIIGEEGMWDEGTKFTISINEDVS